MSSTVIRLSRSSAPAPPDVPPRRMVKMVPFNGRGLWAPAATFLPHKLSLRSSMSSTVFPGM